MGHGKHYYKSLSLLIFVSVDLLLLSCKKDPTSAPDARPYITPQDYNRVILTLTDYDLVRVTHQSGLDLMSQNIIRIGIGMKDSTSFSQILSTASTYDPSVQAYAVHYEFSARLDSSKMVAPLTVRYYLADSTYTDVDTTVNSYKYPYHSAEVFVTTSILMGQDNFFDIARTNSSLYFSPLGDYGVYEYRLSTHQTRLLVNFTEGGHTCAESSSVFFEIERDGIYRYDLLSNTYSRLLQATFPGIVKGLDVFNGKLYVNFAISISPLRVFTFDGTLVDSIAYHPPAGPFIAINDSIVYTVVNPSQFGGRFELSRFDLRTRAFRSQVLSPAKWPGGIKTYANQLYYVDYNKRFVGVVPVSDLTPAQ